MPNQRYMNRLFSQIVIEERKRRDKERWNAPFGFCSVTNVFKSKRSAALRILTPVFVTLSN